MAVGLSTDNQMHRAGADAPALVGDQPRIERREDNPEGSPDPGSVAAVGSLGLSVGWYQNSFQGGSVGEQDVLGLIADADRMGRVESHLDKQRIDAFGVWLPSTDAAA